MDDTRQRLLNVAGKIFAEKGFDSASVREICGAAEANIAAVNYHFGDKEKLYIEAVQAAACHQGPPPNFEWPPGITSEGKLQIFIHHLMTMMLDDDRPEWQISLMMREMARPSQACTELVQNYIGPMFQQLLSIVSEFLPVGTPPMYRHMQAFAVIAQCLLFRYHRPIGRLLVGEAEYQRLFDIDLLTHQIFTFSVGGLHALAKQLEEVQA